MFHFLSPEIPVGFEEFLRTSFFTENQRKSKGNLHTYTVASIFWCSCRENDPLKSTFVKVSKYILSIHGKAHL